jgi:hypothetical protein
VAELTASVTPAKWKFPLIFVALWYGAVPVQVSGAKLFQSAQPACSIVRLPSASSKPLASAIVPAVPQPVAASDRGEAVELESKPGKREELELETEC